MRHPFPQTGEKRCLTPPLLYSEVGDSDPALSPDGKTVAFERNTTVGPARVYTVALSGGSPRPVSPDGLTARNPMWSSDGQHTILFYSFQTGLFTPVFRLEDAAPTSPNLAASRDGRHCGLPRMPRIAPS